ncbi:MAG TPA: hypothetical protein VKQ72_08930, partial [Aggregatilineales bacterium]|nr:hypothetical protein [Aggregatilineales bacterium]
MATLDLPPAMALLRGELGTMVKKIESQAPYGAALLSLQGGLRIGVDNQQEQIYEINPSQGTVLTAFDGATVHEQAIGSFEPSEVDRGAKALLQKLSGSAKGLLDPGPSRKHDYYMGHTLAAKALSVQDKLERCRELHRRVRNLEPRIVNALVSYIEIDETS